MTDSPPFAILTSKDSFPVAEDGSFSIHAAGVILDFEIVPRPDGSPGTCVRLRSPAEGVALVASALPLSVRLLNPGPAWQGDGGDLLGRIRALQSTPWPDHHAAILRDEPGEGQM